MENTNSLFALGLEYEAAAKTIHKRISARREKLRSVSVLSREAYVLKSELRTLYYEYEEAQRTAYYLKNYYNTDSRIAWGGI